MPHHSEKSLALEKKGDQHREKNEIDKAFATYLKAMQLDDTRVPLYDKILDLHERVKDQWTEEDFAANVFWTMKRQELIDPAFKRINFRATPEAKEINKLIRVLLAAKTESDETEAVEAIASHGTDAVYPLLDILLEFKSLGRKK